MTKEDCQQVCNDAISREAAIKTVHKMRVVCDTEDIDDYYELLVESFKQLPPVTQKYGKWIKHPEIETSTPEYLMFYECSECGDKQCFCKSDLHKKRFCNSCGAKMQESEEV